MSNEIVPAEQSPEESVDEFAIERYGPSDFIQSAFNAIGAVDGIDDAILTKQEQKWIKDIKKYSLKILHSQVMEMHDYLFSGEDDDG